MLEQQVGHLLRRAHQRATGIFVAELGDWHGVTPTQYAALVKLRDVGEQSQNELGRLIATDPATTQGVIARLIRGRLVERSRDPGDGRRAKLRLTEQGRDLVERLIPLGVRVTAQTLRPLTARERKLFLQMLARLAGTALDRPRGWAVLECSYTYDLLKVGLTSLDGLRRRWRNGPLRASN